MAAMSPQRASERMVVLLPPSEKSASSALRVRRKSQRQKLSADRYMPTTNRNSHLTQSLWWGRFAGA
jgi:hypothetical protein